MVSYLQKDLFTFWVFTIKNENIRWTGLSIGTTAAIIPFDQKLLENAIELGEPIGLA